MTSIIVGTAGHIDHGKSALVRALTGSDPDRLPEEKKRGITIDLGFADLDLDGVHIGFVDVPGHERFVKNMLAGAHGIDVVMLVVAADEGVMPQTREHFDICRLLNIQRGLIAITKTDLVEPELLPLVRDEIVELVANSFLANAAIVEVSSRTGAGLEQLRRVLAALASDLPSRASHFVTRLPVDRAFAMKGFGAVVTGTLVSGGIKNGDDLELLPHSYKVRARGIQVHGRPVEQAIAGQRTAVNLGGIDTASIDRGMVLAPAGRLRPSQIVDVELNLLGSAPKALRSRARVRVHVGAAEILARLQVLNQHAELQPGTSGFAQLRFESPVALVPDERFIIRSYSPSQTIAGGRVLDPAAPKHRRKDLSTVQEYLIAVRDGDDRQRLIQFTASTGERGLRISDATARTGWTDAALSGAITAAVASQDIVLCDAVLVSAASFAALRNAAVASVKSHHRRDPLSRGLARETLREQQFGHLPLDVFRGVMSSLENERILSSEKDLVKIREHSLTLTQQDMELRDRLAAVYEAAGLESPSADDAFVQAHVPASQRAHGRKLLQLLIDSGVLVRTQSDLIFHRRSLDSLISRVREYGNAHEPERLIDVPAFKGLSGVSRKYAIPLLEYLDSARVTMRAGDRRVITYPST